MSTDEVLFLSHDSVRLAAAMSWRCGRLPPRSSLFSVSLHKFVRASARTSTVTAFFSFEIKSVQSHVYFLLNWTEKVGKGEILICSL